MGDIDDRRIDRGYLLSQQYATSANLRARGDLHGRFGTNSYGWFPWVFDRIEAHGGHVVEVGSGHGLLWDTNRDRVPEGWRLTLVDLSVGMMREARDRLAGLRCRVEFVSADAQGLPLPDACADCVVANHMLYHVPDMGAALAEFRRIVKPGGRLFAATNGNHHMREVRALANRFGPNALQRIKPVDERFGLENGAACLAPWFSVVRVDEYPNSLRVDNADALAAYILSMEPADSELRRRAPDLSAFIRAELAEKGPVVVRTHGGIFEAVPV